MAIASVGSLGSQTSKASTTTLTMTATADAEVGNLVVILTAWDNTATTDGASTNLSCSDESSNTWTKILERTETDGAAEDGTTLAIFYTRVTTQIDAGDDIIITSDTARIAKAMSAWEFTSDDALAVEAFNTAQAPTGQPGALSLSSLTPRTYLFIHGLAMEQQNSGYTQDAAYSNLTFAGTTGGSGFSNQSIFGGFRIGSASSETIDVQLASGAAFVQGLAALYEAGSSAITQTVNQTTMTNTAQPVTAFRVQYLRPTTDISDGGWLTNSGGSDLRAAIDEVSASDADYITSSSSPTSADIAEIKLSTGANPNTSDDGALHHIRYRYKKDSSGGDTINLTVRLVQASTVIASWTHTNISDSYVTVDQTLTDAEANAITDYGDLRLRFEAVKA